MKVRSTLEILRELNVQLRIIRSGTFTSRSISKILGFYNFYFFTLAFPQSCAVESSELRRMNVQLRYEIFALIDSAHANFNLALL